MGAETAPMKITLLLIAAAALAYGQLEEKETIRKNFPAAAHLEVDNVSGFIHVTAYNGADIQMTAEKRIQAGTQEEMDAAKKDVKLDTKESAGTLALYVDGPFRCNCDDHRSSLHNHSHYRVTYDFDLKVPANTFLRLGTVNGGDIRVDGTTADFDLGNVNGAIELHDVAGSGMVHTVNGKINASFTRNPARPCSFKTVNGGIEAAFRPNLSADVRLKTFNGSAYTDFPSVALAPLQPVSERRDGRFIYRSDRTTGIRIGSGGPELKFDTLNGSIRIIDRGQ